MKYVILGNFLVILTLLLIPTPAPTQEPQTPEVQVPPAPTDFYPKSFHQIVLDIEAKRHTKALAQLIKKTKKAKKNYPDLYYLLKGRLHIALNDYTKAITALTQSLKFRNSNSDTLYYLGLAKFKAQKPQEALKYFEEALWFGRHTEVLAEQIHLQIASIWEAEQDFEKATRALEAAIAKNKDFTPARAKLVSLYLIDDNKTGALNNIRQALKADNENVDFQLLLARTLLHRPDRVYGKKDIEEAKTISLALLDRDKLSEYQNAQAHELSIRSHIESAELKKAAEILAKAQVAHPSYPELPNLKTQLATEQQAATVLAAEATVQGLTAGDAKDAGDN